MAIEYRNAEGLAAPPAYTHVAVAHGTQATPIASAPSTLLGVALLGCTGQLVEIEVSAVIDAA